ncbi:ribose-phosphate pyrophosphokinase-like domain-containing protein [Cupriavidus sp. WKF15]|nr:ribose-phosphate pyrophosphokinase-like domain-containing protein [Cupriavidus sp. WKF15]WER50381.1 ribose-phosphate pyrophosphokinase-like domain-containing protein [Cupriavidus sp. WKF15]
MDRVFIAAVGNEWPCAELAGLLHARTGEAEVRHFPDGESYVRLLQPVAGCEIAVVCRLNHPDPKVLPVLWLAAAVRESGAARVGLVVRTCPICARTRPFMRVKSCQRGISPRCCRPTSTGWLPSTPTCSAMAACPKGETSCNKA